MFIEDPANTERAEEQVGREAVVTSSFRVGSPLAGLAFLPNPDAPWQGRIATTSNSGGFDIFNVEGELIITTSGPRLEGLTGIADFPLRGETFPLLFGIDSDNALRGFVVAEEASAVLDLPLDNAVEGTWSSVCAYDSGIGYFELALLGVDTEVAIVRVRDTGGAGLSVQERQRFDLPYPARDCDAVNGDLIVAAPTAGVFRVSAEGQQLAQNPGLSIFDIAATELFGQQVVIATEQGTSALAVYDANSLDQIALVRTEDGLNTAGFERPAILTTTLESYGGISFATGLLAGYDRDDGRVKLLARDVVSRAVFASEDTTG